MAPPRPPKHVKQNRRKVIQIIQHGATVASLDDSGDIWIFDIAARQWLQFPPLPE